ncbi:MAG: Polypeptide-transport-associated domain protein ShlB-type, partial [Rhodoferax sp.]|nr:Polypeptide-transport-associated domain protein ShlB-type [Rhodoferax sp.]
MVIAQRWSVRAALATSVAMPALLGLPSPVHAQVAQQPTQPVVRDPADRVFREQTERERERILERTPDVSEPHTDAATPSYGFPADLPAEGVTFSILHIHSDGDVLLDTQEFSRIAEPFAGHKLGAAHIRLLLDRLNQALVKRGYFTSKAFVADQNLGEGQLTVSFLAGRIERVMFDGEAIAPAHWDHPGVRLALPFSAGDILKLQDVEQAVDQFNRVRGNQVQVQIQPGQEVGGSIVDFRNTPSAHRQYMLSLDNQGSPATGRWRTQGTVEQGNALGLMETFSLGLTTSRDT